MNIYISSKDELKEVVNTAVKQLLEEELPSIIRKAKRKEWLSTTEVMELLDLSRRQIQYLRDNNRISFSQEGKTIRYHIDDIEEYLRSNMITPSDQVK